MILECAFCHARYLVQIGLFAQGGRQVRCARCKKEWHATLPSSIDIFLPPPILAPEPPPGLAAVSSAPPTDAMRAQLPTVIRRMNWVFYKQYARRYAIYAAAVLLLIILLLGARFNSDALVKLMPMIDDVFAALKIDVTHSSNGLTFKDIKSELRYDGGVMKLFVDGVIHNTTGEAQFIPDIKAQALGADKSVIQSWWVDAPAATIPGGSDIPFHTEINAPMKRTIEDVFLEFSAPDAKGDGNHS